MLIIGDLSGIQDFLFDVRETGGKQAASLRYRSFRLQVITECLARRFLWVCGLDESRLLFVAAGKFAIDADGMADASTAVSQAYDDSQLWLFGHAHGRLRFAVGTAPPGSPVVDRYRAAMAALQRCKLAAWQPRTGTAAGWAASALVTDRQWDPAAEAERDAKHGKRLLTDDVVVLAPAPGRRSDESGGDVAGIATSWGRRADGVPEGASVIDLRRLSRHIPRVDGIPVEFIPLAGKARGASMLGVLKADADSLGAAIRDQLNGAPDLAPLRSFSKKLELFFGSELDEMMSSRGSGWADLYTVFSGGDDVLIVGPWNLVIDFAAHVRREFARSFAQEKLTISAGLALVKPRFPVRLGAEQAEELLEQAKTHPAPGAGAARDQFAGWAAAGNGPTTSGSSERASSSPAGSTPGRSSADGCTPCSNSRSSVAPGAARGPSLRQWPARGSPTMSPAIGQGMGPRDRVDALRRNFDAPRPSDAVMTHLPSLLRYAILATRSATEQEQE